MGPPEPSCQCYRWAFSSHPPPAHSRTPGLRDGAYPVWIFPHRPHSQWMLVQARAQVPSTGVSGSFPVTGPLAQLFPALASSRVSPPLSSPPSPSHRPRWAEQLIPSPGAAVLGTCRVPACNRGCRDACHLPKATDCPLVGGAQIWGGADLNSGLGFARFFLCDPG